MLAFSPLQIIAALWVAVTVIWLALALFRSLIGMREEDTIYLSAGEAKMEAEQRVIMQRLNKLTPYSRGFGWASIGLAVVFVGVWGFGVLRELLG